MKISIFWRLLIAALFFKTASCRKVKRPLSPKIILYDGLNQTGEALVLSANYFPKLQSRDFDNRAQSLCLNGTWLLYVNENYNGGQSDGVEYFSGTSFCSNLNTIKQQVSSMRFAGSSLDIYSDSITFYFQTFFQGLEEYFTKSANALEILKNETRSLIVTGSSGWRIYDQEEFRGDSFCVKPNASLTVYDTQVIHIPHGSIKSVKLGCDE